MSMARAVHLVRRFLRALTAHVDPSGRQGIAANLTAAQRRRPSGSLRRLAKPSGSGWRRALASIDEHGRRGAALAQEAGAPPAVVELIRHHQREHLSDRRAALLRTA